MAARARRMMRNESRSRRGALATPDNSQTLLSEDEMRRGGFEVPVDERERGQVERGMREHRDPDLSRDREDGSEREPGDRGLLDAGEPLVRIVGQRKQPGGE